MTSPAEGEPSDALNVEAWGGGASPALSRRRRIPSSASLDSLDSASSYGGLSVGSSHHDYRAVIKGALGPTFADGACFH